MEKVCGVYQIVCLVTGKLYVGSSTNVYARLATHRSSLDYGKHHCVYLQRAYIKYGAENFAFELLEETDRVSLLVIEQHYIDLNIGGFNMRKIAESNSGLKRSAETCARQSASMTGTKHLPGRKKRPPHSQETRAKCAAARKAGKKNMLGRHHSEETKAKMSAAAKRRPEISEETRVKMSIASRRSHSPETRAKMKASQTLRRANENVVDL